MPAKIYVLHENDDWFAPLSSALTSAALPHASWNLAQGTINLHEDPPPGIFFNRMSASAHTRGHLHAPEFAAALIAWLEGSGRRVINGSSALQLELSKVAQYALLRRFGFVTPKTVAVYGREQALQAASAFGGRFITKHNRSGKGLGVRLVQSAQDLQALFDSGLCPEPVDGLWLLQEYIQAPEPFITRMEFVGGRFVYAVRVDTSGGFELCPADSCALEDRCALSSSAKFEITPEVPPDLPRYEAMLAAQGVEVAGVEIIKDAEGRVYTYDINVNTNYNSEAEQKAGLSALEALAAFLGRELKQAVKCIKVGSTGTERQTAALV